jgi:hypothetical protein
MVDPKDVPTEIEVEAENIENDDVSEPERQAEWNELMDDDGNYFAGGSTDE